MSLFPNWPVVILCLTGLLSAPGCERENPGQTDQPDLGPGRRSPSEIKQIMVELASGPQSLTAVIDREMNQNPPSWNTIQNHTRNYAKLAGKLATYGPPKGSKESWIALTSAFVESASALDRAAAAHDLDGARVAHDQLKSSCNACHQPHRNMVWGGGKPGGLPPDRPR
jgi:hypothetical protein